MDIHQISLISINYSLTLMQKLLKIGYKRYWSVQNYMVLGHSRIQELNINKCNQIKFQIHICIIFTIFYTFWNIKEKRQTEGVMSQVFQILFCCHGIRCFQQYKYKQYSLCGTHPYLERQEKSKRNHQLPYTIQRNHM